jgi:hypothetical protein
VKEVVARVARQYGTGEEQVRVVLHARDYEEAFDFHPVTRALMRAYDLYSPVILGVYPLRMDCGKQPEKAIRLFSQLKAAGSRCGSSWRRSTPRVTASWPTGRRSAARHSASGSPTTRSCSPAGSSGCPASTPRTWRATGSSCRTRS